MTPTDTASPQTLAAEQVFEIQTMAEGGQFADALIRLRKIKAFYPHTTSFVALEKQLERLLVLPRDSETSEAQKRELLGSLPGLIHDAMQAMRSGPPTRPTPTPTPPKPTAHRSDRDVARAQLKEQYFQHADEYLKKGAYGSALVEIRRVKIIAPDDQAALEYERTIRQLVELQQRTGIRPEQPAQPAQEPTKPQVTAHPILTFDDEHEIPPKQEAAPLETVEPSAAASRRRGKRWLFGLTFLALLGGGAATAVLLPPSDEVPEQQPAKVAQPRVRPRAAVVPPVSPGPAERDPVVSQAEPASSGKVEEKTQQQPDGASIAGEPNRAFASALPNPAGMVKTSSPERVAKTPAEPAAIEQTSGARDPHIVRLEQPVFPPDVLALPGGGDVVIMVQIDEQGKPVRTLVAKSTNPAFNQPIITAVMNSTYEAGRSSSGPETKWLTIPFTVN